MTDLTCNREFRSIYSEIFELFNHAGFHRADIILEFQLKDDVLIWGVGGDDEIAIAVMRGILKVICTEHGIDFDPHTDA